MLCFVLGTPVPPAGARARARYLEDKDFRQRPDKGPRPLFYFSSGRYWPGRGMINPCRPLVGGGYYSPTLVVYSDRTVIFVPPPKSDKQPARFHRAKLTAKEMTRLRRTVVKAGLDTMKDFYDLVPGAHHARTNLLISWLSGRRRSVAIRGGGGLHLPAYVSARKQRHAQRLPAPLVELQRELASFSNRRARPWSPGFEVHLSPWPDKKPKTIPWPAGWPKPKLAPTKDPKSDQKFQTARAKLPGRLLSKVIQLLGTRDGCLNRDGRLFLWKGKRWLSRIVLPPIPQQRLWQHPHAEVPEIVVRLQSEHSDVRGRGISALERAAWHGVAPHLRMLWHRSPRVRGLTAMSLGLALEHGGTGKTPFGLSYADLTSRVTGPLTGCLKDPEELVRIHAAIALWRIRKTARAIPIIAQSLQSKSVPLRRLGASALDKIAPKAAAAAPALRQALSDRDVEVRVMAALALHKQTGKGDARRVIPVLSAALNIKTKMPNELRDKIVERLGVLARSNAKVWPTIITALKDRHYHARGAAVKALASRPKQAHRAIPGLLRILTIDTGYVRDEARKLLLHLKAERQVVTTLIKALKSKDYDVRYWSASDLQELGPRARAAVPALIHALKNDPRVPVRAGSAAALGSIGRRTPDVLEALREASRSKEWPVRGRAKDALKKLGRGKPKKGS